MHSRGTIKNIGALDVWNLIKTGFHASRFETDICTHTYMYIGKDSSQQTSVHGAILRGKDRILNHLEPCPNELIFKRRSKERERETKERRANSKLAFPFSSFFFIKRRAFENCRAKPSLPNPIADVSPFSYFFPSSRPRFDH